MGQEADIAGKNQDTEIAVVACSEAVVNFLVVLKLFVGKVPNLVAAVMCFALEFV